MWNQPEEYFIEVVSNASMEDFPDNTLSKFTNKLPVPLQLDGDWVVGIQEIFYPIDLAPDERIIKVQLFTSDKNEKILADVTLNENDSPDLIVSKINDALHELFSTATNDEEKKNNKTKRSLEEKENKPFKDDNVGTLNALSIEEVQAITPEKMRALNATERLNLYNSIKDGVPIILNTLYKAMERFREESLTKDKKINMLNEEIKSFSSMLDVTRAEKKEEHKKYKESKREFDKKIKELNELNTNIDVLKRKVTKLEQKIKTSEESVQRENAKAHNVNAMLNQKEAELRNTHYEFEKFKNDQHLKIENLQNEIEKVRQEKIVDKNSRESYQNIQIKKLQTEIDNLKSELRNSSDNYETRISKLTNDLNSQKSAFTESSRKLAMIEQQNAVKKIEFQDELTSLQKKIQDLKMDKAALENDIKQKTRQIENNEIEIQSLKSREIDLQSQLGEKEEFIKHQIKDIEDEKVKIESMRIELEKKENLLLQRLSELGIVMKTSIVGNKTDEFMNVPGLAYINGKISMFPGRINDKTYIPFFGDMSFLNALGFDASTYLQMIDELSSGKKSFTSNKRANLNLRSHLMFINSDIVAEHFVGNTSARVMRVLPIKRGKEYELIHEKFLKPFYYPVRSNRIEDINFILTDEMGQIIKFNSGRVLVGLHLKRA